MKLFFHFLLLSLCVESFLTAQLKTPISFTASDYAYPVDNIAQAAHPTIGVGPCNVLVGSQNGVYSFTKKGCRDFIMQVSPTDFFAGADGSVVQTSHIRFDKFTNRWFLFAIDPGVFAGRPMSFFITVSDGPKITQCTQWRRFKLQMDQIAPAGDTGLVQRADFDFASFGIDQNALYFGTNLYRRSPTPTGAFQYVSSSLFVVQKQSLLAGTPHATAFRQVGTAAGGIYAPAAVDNYDNDSAFGYFIGVDRVNTSQLLLFRISGAGTNAPTLQPVTTIPIQNTAEPLLAPYKNVFGAAVRVWVIDRRLFNAHIRNNQLYTVQHIAVNQNGVSQASDRDGIRWYQIGLSAAPTVNFGTLFDNSPLSGNTRSFFYPSIMTNEDNLMVISGSLSSLNESINAFATHGAVNTLPTNDELRNSLQMLTNSTHLQNSTTNFANVIGAGIGIELWGMYSTSAPDNKAIWSVNEFALGSPPSIWGTNVTKLKK